MAQVRRGGFYASGHRFAGQQDRHDRLLIISGDLANFLKAAKGFDLFSGGTRLFTSGLDLLKLATFKDGLPEGALGTLWYPFYAINSPESTAFVEEVKKRSDTYPTGSTLVGYIGGKMLAEAMGKATNPDDPKTVAKIMGTVAFESPVGPVRVRACDNMALYNFYVGTVKHDPSLPDGIGAVNVKPYNTADYARTCEEIAKLRQ